MGGTAATAMTFQFVGEKEDPWWTNEILIDLPIRTWVGAKSDRGEGIADKVSDATLITASLSPWFLSVGGAVAHESGDVAGQLALITASSHSVNLAVTNAMKLVIGRERPPLSACFAERIIDPDHECDPRPTVSFPSGHTSVAFTGAGLVCAFGNALPLYGDGFSNDLPCIGALTLASTTGIFRIVANAHHLSDVIVGAGIGLGAGWLLPYLVHFRNAPGPEPETRTQAMGRIPPITIGGTF